MSEEIPREFSKADIARMFNVSINAIDQIDKLAQRLGDAPLGGLMPLVRKPDESGPWDKFLYCTTGLYLGPKCRPFDYESLNGQTRLFLRESCCEVSEIITKMMNSGE